MLGRRHFSCVNHSQTCYHSATESPPTAHTMLGRRHSSFVNSGQTCYHSTTESPPTSHTMLGRLPSSFVIHVQTRFHSATESPRTSHTMLGRRPSSFVNHDGNIDKSDSQINSWKSIQHNLAGCPCALTMYMNNRDARSISRNDVTTLYNPSQVRKY